MNDSQDFYKKLKEWGVKTEEELNTFIQEFLNKKEFMVFANQKGKEIMPVLKKLQNNIEQLSVIYNFPTKNDVAAVAKLAIQIEEKVEKIEETLTELSQQIKEINSQKAVFPASGLLENALSGLNEKSGAPQKEPQAVSRLQAVLIERLAAKIKNRKIEGVYDPARMKKSKKKNIHG
ncbi:hypothetical protein [Bacillus sp. MUM 13]|uniref:hypothetical protein n=1 Tax=Bacillus sp. MUM 13 TaxID=1678001 RepID=UPI0008F5A980|nr:hypothetical protein [Bacillus sp. MUM 13]OIK14848.1 hypothetical protein BIV59_01305 [Bacillus sp. MUM 13]